MSLLYQKNTQRDTPIFVSPNLLKKSAKYMKIPSLISSYFSLQVVLKTIYCTLEVLIMNIDSKNILKSILDSMSQIDYIKPEDIPNIPLYMDQVTTFMDSQLQSSKRYEEDKILTKTMINNYAKNDLIPPPVKKKYSKEHLLILIFVYYFKSILSISDIHTLLRPINEKYFHGSETLKMTDLYQEVFSLEKSQVDHMAKDLIRQYDIAEKTFSDAAAEDQAFLHQFAFICILSFDVYVKKQMIEKMIDQMTKKDDPEKKEKKEKK